MESFATFMILFCIFIWPLAFFVALIYWLCKAPSISRSMYSGIPEDITAEDLNDVYDDAHSFEPSAKDEFDELSFCQMFNLSSDMCLLIQYVDMCPDETAFIRVLAEETYTPQYKRKVRRTKGGDRYIVFNGVNYYLDDSKTKPRISTK